MLTSSKVESAAQTLKPYLAEGIEALSEGSQVFASILLKSAITEGRKLLAEVDPILVDLDLMQKSSILEVDISDQKLNAGDEVLLLRMASESVGWTVFECLCMEE